LPMEHNDNWAPMEFPIKAGKGLCLFDPHFPYHDINAITLAIRYGQEKGCKDFVFLGGDVHDNKDLSKFSKDPDVRKYKEELDDVKIFLDVLQRAFPQALIIYKKGNHELRTDNFLIRKAPELWGLKEFIWDEYLGLRARGILSVPDDVPLRVGKLNIIHGHELRGSSTVVNPARGVYMKAMECMLTGHWHRSAMHTETSFSRRFDASWSVGCLCNLSPDWCRINKWNQGFCTLEVDGNDFTIKNERIIDGKIR
jgi:predicted phosphodiesterase